MAGRPKTRAKKNRALAAAASPEDFKRLLQVGIKCGIDARAMERLVARLQGRSLSAKGGRLKLDDRELLALINDRLALAFEYLDEVTFGEANARDLATNIGILIDKRRLLRDQPTAITRREDVAKLDEFLVEAVEELRRGGVAMPEVVDVTPPAAALVENGEMS